MTTVNIEQLNKKIEYSNFKFCTIYDGFYNRAPSGASYFERFECEDPQELIQLIKDFSSEYAGAYTLILKKSAGTNINGACLVRLNLVPEKISQEPGQQLAGFNPEEYKSQVLKEIKNEMVLTQIKAQNEMYKSRLTELETTSGKLAFMFENWAIAKMGGKAPMFQNKLQGTVEIENDESEISDEEFTKALIKLKDMLGAQTIVNIAKNYDKDNPMIQTIKNAVNNG